MQKINMSVAIVCMINNTALQPQLDGLNENATDSENSIHNDTTTDQCGGSVNKKSHLVNNFLKFL